MAIILTGPFATQIKRLGATSAEILSAEQCDLLLRRSYVTNDGADALIASLKRGFSHWDADRFGMGLAEGDVYEDLPAAEVLIWGHASLRPREGILARHATFSLPQTSLLHVDPALGLGDETYVTAPWLTWVLGSSRVPDARALEMGMELCGTYATSSTGHTSYQVNHACTPSELARGIRELDSKACGQRIPGLARVKSMVPFVLSGSASPMESKVAVMLSLPITRGGWGLNGLSLNRRIDLTKEQRAIAGQAFLVIDGCVANRRLGYEYDSFEYHDRHDREYRDRVRVTAAQCLGYRLLSLTADVVMDEERFCAFGDEFSRLAGKRLRRLAQSTLERRHETRRDLGLPVADRFVAQGYDVPLSAYMAAGGYGL